MQTTQIKTSISRSPVWRGFLLLPLVLALFGLAPAPNALGVVPAPDGGYVGANTAEGDGALFSLTTGMANTAIGNDALFFNTAGSNNTANGFAALFTNTTGSHNTANGVSALQENTTASNNTANGFSALLNNTTGSNNTADGVQALRNNNTGSNNTADGVQALHNNNTGSNNTASGEVALFRNTTGNFNTANGAHSLVNNTTGSSNIALGFNAGDNLTIGNNNIDIGNGGVAGESHTTHIGTQGTQTRTFIAGISGTAVTGSPVVVNASGQLGLTASSERFKDEIKPMNKASETILALQPVTFRYKKEIDPAGTSQFGLVAEQVEKVNPDLIVRDKDGKPYSVRYDQVNAMLLNEFLKEHRTVQEQQNEIDVLRAELKEQRALIQKVNDKVELAKPAPQTVLNNQ